jgi:hypothetical protein
MSDNDAWDWVLLYYAGTVILRMSLIQFWKCTPRKLSKLVDMYVQLNSSNDKKQEDKPVYIDQVV